MITPTSLPERLMDARRTALIVDGDPQLRKVMGMQLELMDFRVLSSSHFDGAVRHLTTGDLHFACVDVQLPSKSGYELCEHIRGSLGLLGLPILMTSEYGNPEDMAYAEAAGGNAFLRKPFSMQELTRCVESLLNTTLSKPSMHELQPIGIAGSKHKVTGNWWRIDAPRMRAVA
jgi:DNA-binding response OmpR family regulator